METTTEKFVKERALYICRSRETVAEQQYLAILDCASHSIRSGCTRQYPLCAVMYNNRGLMRKVLDKVLRCFGYDRLMQPFCRRYLS